MKSIIKVLKPAIVAFFIFTVICGVFYTAAVTGVAQVFFPHQANGSIIEVAAENGEEEAIGSELIAQEFSEPEYLIGRPAWDRNFSPTSEELNQLMQERMEWLRNLDPDNKSEIPVDLVTTSGSGVDPHISPEAAEYQVSRIASERNLEEETVKEIIQEQTTGRFLGFWGEPAVNVLKVNLMLDELL